MFHGNILVQEVILREKNREDSSLILWWYLGATGTPTFLINGVAVSADASWSLADWKSVIDPLLASNVQKSSPVQVCPAGQKECQYLPGKTQCCLAGESCIQNVGCRCFNLRNGKCF